MAGQKQEARQAAKKIVKKYFKNDYGKPFKLTDGQADIFNLIFTKKYPRNQIIACTQYGKSDTISMGLIMRSILFREPFVIIAGRKEQAQIIMGKLIQHIFDHKRFSSQLELDPNMPLDRLKRKRTQDNIVWKGGGGVKTLSANVAKKEDQFTSLSGFGCPNIVEDESALIGNQRQAMVMRMLGGHAKNWLLKIGNPFQRNHFYRTWESPKYHRLFIDHLQAVKEGRYTDDFIEEMKLEPFFDILYACKFPPKEVVLSEGYRRLITSDLLNSAFITQAEFAEVCKKELKNGRKVPKAIAKLGCDFAGAGRDRNAYVIRWGNYMFKLSTNKISDTMQQVPIIRKYIKNYRIPHGNVGIDYGGLGQGIGDRLHELDVFANCVTFGSGAIGEDRKKYKNKRAYMFYQFHKWIKEGGKIVKDNGFMELLYINYKEDSAGRFMIQPKKDLKKELQKNDMRVFSPDIADAGALTFADSSEYVDVDDVDIV